MSAKFPECKTVLLDKREGCLYLTFNRPEVRNAMSAEMNSELRAMFEAIRDDRQIRIVVLRGAGGWFCSGGDMKERQATLESKAGEDIRAIKERNVRAGLLFNLINTAPQAVVAVVEGAALGGGFGMACVADVTITRADAVFGLPETGIGVPPAQIAPYVVKRVGLTQARRLAVTGARFKGREAVLLGVAHYACETADELDEKLEETVMAIRRCGPGAIAITKEIMLRVGSLPDKEMIDYAAERFAGCVTSPEGREGTLSFIEKRTPNWSAVKQ